MFENNEWNMMSVILADMEQDTDVRKKNQDILNFVKELF